MLPSTPPSTGFDIFYDTPLETVYVVDEDAKKANFYKSLLPEKLHSLIVELPAEKKTKK